MLVNGVKSEWFNVECGLHKGCIFSPLLFNIFVNDLAQELNDINVGVPIKDIIINVLLYTDELCLIAKDEAALQVLLDKLDSW